MLFLNLFGDNLNNLIYKHHENTESFKLSEQDYYLKLCFAT